MLDVTTLSLIVRMVTLGLDDEVMTISMIVQIVMMMATMITFCWESCTLAMTTHNNPTLEWFLLDIFNI